jgi:hypothetical protein
VGSRDDRNDFKLNSFLSSSSDYPSSEPDYSYSSSSSTGYSFSCYYSTYSSSFTSGFSSSFTSSSYTLGSSSSSPINFLPVVDVNKYLN